MVLPRPTVLRSFAPSRLLRAAPRTANRAVARRGYASGHGDGHAAPSSDVPWALAAVGVTLPTCWYLWPSGAHAEAHHPETKHERAEALTHEGDEKSEEVEEEKPTPESKGDTEGVQFKGKTSDGDDENKQDDTRKVEDDSKGGKKLRIDSASAVDLGSGPAKRSDGSDSAATNKEIDSSKGGEGEMSSKQAGISTTATKHSTDIANDPEKSKKGEGSPETAKSSGTVSVNRPHTEQRKGEEQENAPNPDAAKETKGDDKKENDKSEDKSEDKPEEKKDDEKKDE